MIEFEYKIPLSHALIVGGLLLFIAMGAHGYVDDSFKQTEFAKLSSNTALGAWLVFCLISPRNRKIIISKSGIYIPNILIPPYKGREISWVDMYDWDVKVNKNFTATIILKTKNRDFKIQSWLCLGNFELAITPKSFNKLQERISEEYLLANEY